MRDGLRLLQGGAGLVRQAWPRPWCGNALDPESTQSNAGVCTHSNSLPVCIPQPSTHTRWAALGAFGAFAGASDGKMNSRGAALQHRRAELPRCSGWHWTGCCDLHARRHPSRAVKASRRQSCDPLVHLPCWARLAKGMSSLHAGTPMSRGETTASHMPAGGAQRPGCWPEPPSEALCVATRQPPKQGIVRPPRVLEPSQRGCTPRVGDAARQLHGLCDHRPPDRCAPPSSPPRRIHSRGRSAAGREAPDGCSVLLAVDLFRPPAAGRWGGCSGGAQHQHSEQIAKAATREWWLLKIAAPRYDSPQPLAVIFGGLGSGVLLPRAPHLQPDHRVTPPSQRCHMHLQRSLARAALQVPCRHTPN